MAPLHEHQLFYESRPHYFPYIALSALPISIKIPRMCKLVSLFFFFSQAFSFDVVFFQLSFLPYILCLCFPSFIAIF